MQLIFLIVALGLSSCAYLKENPAGSEVTPAAQNETPLNGDDTGAALPKENPIELQLAKLQARIEELETEHLQQRERMALIEKGLMLGVVPDELKRKDWKLVAKSDLEKSSEGQQAHQSVEEQGVVKKDSQEKIKSKDVTDYRRLLQQAQDKFNSANYGQAIAIFNDIGEKFDDSLTEGSHHYWIGLGWFYLKENQLAEQSLSQLKDRYVQSRWVPYARYYLAKIDQMRGLQNKALDQMRALLEEFPNQEVGEMARQEVQRMRESF